jgi:hypothetical protein
MYTDLTKTPVWTAYYDDYQKKMETILVELDDVLKNFHTEMNKIEIKEIQGKLKKFINKSSLKVN